MGASLLSAPTNGATRAARLGDSAEDLVSELDGVCAAMLRLKRDILSVARDAFVSVLVLGESGTGKERVARAIHRLSPRRRHPFVVINCGGLTSTLADDALFGHVRGAFTGAVSGVPGPFERANGGTVFLDEVGELPPELQVKLLRALQERTVLRLGATSEAAFDVRVVSATNANLRPAVHKGRFREDLYYRLHAYELRVPPLRARGAADLQRLVTALLERLARRRGRPAPTLAPAVWDAFGRYEWPGNIRELENMLERMIVASAGRLQLTDAELADDFGASMSESESASSRTPTAEMPTAAEAWATLARNRFKHGRTATELGLSRHQLYRLLKRADSPERSERLPA